MTDKSAIAFLKIGRIVLQRGHTEEATRFFRAALKIKPDMIEAYIELGVAYANNSMYVGMASAFRRAVKLDPLAVRKWAKSSLGGKPVWLSNSPEYSHLTGEMAELLRRIDETEALIHISAAHLVQGSYRAAVTTLEYCLKLTPNYKTVVILLTAAYLLFEVREGGVSAEEGRRSALRSVSNELVEELFLEG